MVTAQEIDELLVANESEHLEFKEAKSKFDYESVVKYCAALANEGGGRLVLGVVDGKPRRVCGTNAFRDTEALASRLFQKLRLRIAVDTVTHPAGRVIVFTAPSRPPGMPIEVDGAYLMRVGESLVPMNPERLRAIFAEANSVDYSAEVVAGASLGDLEPEAIAQFRRRWHWKAKIDSILMSDSERLLADAELIDGDGSVTVAALVLLGRRSSLRRLVPQAELIFEFRSSEAPGPASQRVEFQEGFLLYLDRLWDLVNLRNDRQHYQDGLFMIDIETFNEAAIREAILNAVAHRDYRRPESVFVRQYHRRIEVVSPGGLPAGVTPENILDRQSPRNRRIAEALAKCGLVERSGQGADRIFESALREGKALPDFHGTDDWQVSLTLQGQVRDPRFVRFLERVGSETGRSFDTRELLILDLIHREQPVPASLKSRIPPLLDAGIIEQIGRGRGIRHLLSRRFHVALGESGGYTRRRGLDWGTNKQLIYQHLVDCGDEGCPIGDLEQVLPSQSRGQIKRLLRELRQEGRATLIGERRWAKWVAISPERPAEPPPSRADIPPRPPGRPRK